MNWHPRRIGDEIRRELGRLGPEAGLDEIVRAWPEAVGSAIAANAWPARVARDGTLHVATASSAWAFELTHLEGTVRAHLRDRVGAKAPPRVRFAVGLLPERGPESDARRARTVPRASPADAAEGARLAGGIEHSELRALVARAAAASLARARADRRL